jgi:SAM-dependent methyltransferase
MNLRDQMDRIYRDLPAEQIPWNLLHPPKFLVDLVRTGKIRPCDAVDIGCGAGNHTVWLATRGFRMTGLDISPTALQLARRHAREMGVRCHFREEDLTGDEVRSQGAYDFGMDWEVLHHVFPPRRPTFVRNVHAMLRPGAIHLSVCFSVEDEHFGGIGKYRKTPLETTLYFSSEEEIEQAFATNFDILELRTIEVEGKYGTHRAVAALLERK